MRSFYIVIATGFLFHSIYLLSIFDIYFCSPLVHGPPAHTVLLPPLAKRVVLFVADGLRADKLYESEAYRAPFLRKIIQNKGSWGVSHTRVPTETRPGHVALIAGFYEDVSAVTKGWKYNPVEFDSVFNRSTFTWGFGSPDVLPMFSHDTPHVFMKTYPAESEDFALNSTLLDQWVFDEMHALLHESRNDTQLSQRMHSSGVIFFLHLLALDSYGHAYRPYSNEYLSQISFVDAGIHRITAAIDEYFGDGATAYVFTSDHGMSNKGNHGDGEEANTNTPLICWGAGIAGPVFGKSDHNNSIEWGLSHLFRRDVNQADIAPMIAALLAIPFPVNSVGVLPVAYLGDNNTQYSSVALYNNALAVLEQFLIKSRNKEASAMFFSPFMPLQHYFALVQQIDANIDIGMYAEANLLSQTLIQLSLDGLSYFQTYDWPFLITTISLGYIGWIVVVTLFVVVHYTDYCDFYNKQPHYHHKLDWFAIIVTLSVGLLLCVYNFLQQSPLLYYAYVLFPVSFWGWILHHRDVIAVIKVGSTAPIFSAIIAMEGLVVVYFCRSLFSIGFIVLAMWPLGRLNKQLSYFWCGTCGLVAVFPLLPVEYGENIFLVLLGAFMIASSATFIVLKNSQIFMQGYLNGHFFLPICLVVTAAGLAFFSTSSLAAKQGLPVYNQVLSWIVLGICTVMLLNPRKQHTLALLLRIYLYIASTLILLSISYEVIFCFALASHLYCWVLVENATENPEVIIGDDNMRDSSRNITMPDLRRAVFYIVLSYAAIFGTGNVASISSFELSSTYRFVTVFSPFLMSSLLIWKLLAPVALVTCTYTALVRMLRVPQEACFLIVIMLADIMTLNFFYLVRDEGSWQEIGASIGHFAISNCFIILQLMLFAFTLLVLKGSSFNLPLGSLLHKKHKL